MSWQEDLHRRNQAEAAQTRARIAEGNARMQADTRARQARDAAQSAANHKATMERITRDGKNMWGNQGAAWSPRPLSRQDNSPTQPARSSPGTAAGQQGNHKVATLISLALLGIGALWLAGKIDGNAALGLVAFLIGLCVVIAILANIKKIVVVLFKLAVIILVGYIIVRVIAAHS